MERHGETRAAGKLARQPPRLRSGDRLVVVDVAASVMKACPNRWRHSTCRSDRHGHLVETVIAVVVLIVLAPVVVGLVVRIVVLAAVAGAAVIAVALGASLLVRRHRRR